MQVCYNHYYCLCGRYENERTCHYCRKQNNIYKRHYVCFNCCIGWKSKNEIKLKPTTDGGQLIEYESHNDIDVDIDVEYQGARCMKCSKDADEVGRDFRLPKQSDTKAWMKLKNLKVEMGDEISAYMIKKYTYNCGEKKGESLYIKRLNK